MDERRFEALIRSLGNRTTRRGVLGLLAGAAAVGVGEAGAKRGRAKRGKQNGRGNNGGNSGKAGKVDVCHRTGNGSFRLINVSRNALDAHLRHGDARPGDPVPGEDDQIFGDDCAVVEVETACSPPLAFGPNGWGGWSCPDGTRAVGGSFEPEDATVQRAEIAEPGDVFPHHTFGDDEWGFVVQNDNDTETITVCVECVPS